MRYDEDDLIERPDGLEPFAPLDPLPPEGEAPPRRRRWIRKRYIAAGIVAFFMLLVGWLAITAPLSRSLQPIAPPSITLVADDGTPIARKGALVAQPVRLSELPKHVPEAFIAIEDRRYYSHWEIG